MKRGGRAIGGKEGGRSDGNAPSGEAGAASVPASAGHLSKLKKLVRDDFLRLRSKFADKFAHASKTKRADQRRSLARVGERAAAKGEQPAATSSSSASGNGGAAAQQGHQDSAAATDAQKAFPWLAPSPRLWGGSAP